METLLPWQLMTAAHLRAGLHLIYLVAPLVRLACTERSGYACSESEWPSITVVTSFSKILFAAMVSNFLRGVARCRSGSLARTSFHRGMTCRPSRLSESRP